MWGYATAGIGCAIFLIALYGIANGRYVPSLILCALAAVTFAIGIAMVQGVIPSNWWSIFFPLGAVMCGNPFVRHVMHTQDTPDP